MTVHHALIIEYAQVVFSVAGLIISMMSLLDAAKDLSVGNALHVPQSVKLVANSRVRREAFRLWINLILLASGAFIITYRANHFDVRIIEPISLTRSSAAMFVTLLLIIDTFLDRLDRRQVIKQYEREVQKRRRIND